MADRPQHLADVLVVGAGYAGVHAAAAARDAGADVVLVDASGHHELLPRLAAVAAGRLGPGDAWAHVDDLDVGRWLAGRVERVEADTATVVLAGGRRVTAGAVVVATGAGAALPPVDGLDERSARTLRSARDALLLRDELDDADALVVVGAGPTGVQLAAEAARARPSLTVTLVDERSTVLPSFGRRLRRHAARVLRAREVRVLLDRRVATVTPDGVATDRGEQLTGTVVWTTGVRAAGDELLAGVPVRDGQVLVDRCLRAGARVFVAGDLALHRDLLGATVAPSAQVALQAGRAAGANAAAVAAGGEPSPARIVDLGWIVDLGGRGVAAIGPVPLAGRAVDRLVPLLHHVVDTRHLLLAGGLRGAAEHAPGRHVPADAELATARRAPLRPAS